MPSPERLVISSEVLIRSSRSEWRVSNQRAMRTSSIFFRIGIHHAVIPTAVVPANHTSGHIQRMTDGKGEKA